MSQDTRGVRYGFGVVVAFIVLMQVTLWSLVGLLDRK
jgi:hypothetical protein